MHLADRVGDIGGRDDRADAPAGDAEGLRGAADRDRAIGHPRQRRDRNVLALIVDVLVDLVGHGKRVMALAQLGDRLELGPRQDAAGRIIGRADDDGARLGAEGPGQALEVDGPFGGHRNEDRLCVAEDRVGPVVLVKRLENDHFVAGIDDPK